MARKKIALIGAGMIGGTLAHLAAARRAKGLAGGEAVRRMFGKTSDGGQ